jgi:hypothetical protein
MWERVSREPGRAAVFLRKKAGWGNRDNNTPAYRGVPLLYEHWRNRRQAEPMNQWTRKRGLKKVSKSNPKKRGVEKEQRQS